MDEKKIVELKAAAYDALANIEKLQNQLRALNEAINQEYAKGKPAPVTL